MMPVMTLVMNGVSLLIVWFGGKQIAEPCPSSGNSVSVLSESGEAQCGRKTQDGIEKNREDQNLRVFPIDFFA